MTSLQRLTYRLQIPMLIFLPVWIGIGRLLFGAGGWLMLVTLFLGTPILFIWLLLLAVLTLTQPDVRARKALLLADARLFAAVYASLFLFGFFVVDGGDTDDSVGSAFSMLLGHHLIGLSAVFAFIALLASLVSLCVVTGRTIAHRVHSRKHPLA